MQTNFFIIDVSCADFEIQRLAYSEKTLQDLRTKHNSVASFFRNEDFIYVSPGTESLEPLGQMHPLKTGVEHNIVCSLIRHILFRKFRDAFPDRLPISFSPLRFLSLKDSDDPIRNLLPENLRNDVGFPRVIEVHVKGIRQNDNYQYGLVISVRNRWKFSFSLQHLFDVGFPVVGCTVLESVPLPGLDGILAPDESVVGEVLKVEGDIATVQTNEGVVEKSLKSLTMQRTYTQLGKYLEHGVGKAKAKQVFTAIRQNTQSRSNQNYLYAELYKVASWFSTQEYGNSDGFCFKVTKKSEIVGRSFQLERTRLVFDYSGASEFRPLGGLNVHGPYDSTRFDKKKPRVLVVFQERNRGFATQCIARLRDGIKESKYFKLGFQALFRLNDVVYHLSPISNTAASEYEKVIDKAVAQDGPFDMAIVECPDNSERMPNKENPYLRAKLRLFNYGIPVQGIRESHMCDSAKNQSFTMGPMALQIYAKLGGVPWLLPAGQSIDHELIVGIGNAITRENMWKGVEQSRIVGLTTFFLGEGRYVFGKELPAVDYSDYFGALLENLTNSLSEIASEYHWKENETVRLVFHIFKPLKNIEVDVVAKLVEKFPQFNIRFAFVTISTKHPWLLLREAKPAKNSQGQNWNAIEADRGDNLVLDDRSCLLQLKGPKDRTNYRQPLPPPVLIRIHENSTYFDLQFIAQQIQDFSYLSWRSFFPVELPVTIEYSNLMAKLSSKLRSLDDWNPLAISQHLRRKKWFL